MKGLSILKVLLFGLLLSPHWGFAQNKVTATENIPKTPLQWNFSYLGEMGVHPGIKVGIERQLTGFKTTKTKYRKSKVVRVKERTRVFFWTLNAGSYYHRNNNTGILLNGEIGYRKIRNQGLKTEAMLGIGYIHTFWPGTTYLVESDGSVTTRKLTSNGGFTTHFSLGFGRDLTFIKNRKWAWHFRPTILWQVPYNTGILARFFTELGITYRFSKA